MAADVTAVGNGRHQALDLLAGEVLARAPGGVGGAARGHCPYFDHEWVFPFTMIVDWAADEPSPGRVTARPRARRRARPRTSRGLGVPTREAKLRCNIGCA